MEKIAIVQKIEYYVPTVATLRKAEQLPTYEFLRPKDFEIGILDNKGEIQSINTQLSSYMNFVEYKLGDVVIYDDETNTVICRRNLVTDRLTETETSDIIQFLKQYKKKYVEATKTSDNNKKEQLLGILRSLVSDLKLNSSHRKIK